MMHVKEKMMRKLTMLNVEVNDNAEERYHEDRFVVK